jgi:transmembrane sensor
MAIAPNRQVFEAAASWYVQFQTDPPTLAEQKAWQLWIDSDPAHLAAWNQMEQMQRHLGTLPQDLKRRALNTGQQRRQVLKLLLLGAGTGFVGWNVQHHASLGNVWADYKTGVGRFAISHWRMAARFSSTPTLPLTCLSTRYSG